MTCPKGEQRNTVVAEGRSGVGKWCKRRGTIVGLYADRQRTDR